MGQVVGPVSLCPRQVVERGRIVEHVQTGGAGQGVGADGQQIALLQIGAHGRVLARDRDSVRPGAQRHADSALAQDAAVLRARPHAVGDVHVGAQRTELVEELDGGGVEPFPFELRVAGPMPVAPGGGRVDGQVVGVRAGLHRCLGQMDVQTHVQLAGDVGQVHERRGLQRVRGVRADADAGQPLLTHLTHRAQMIDQFADACGLPVTVVPVHHLPVGHAVHALRGERVGRLRVGDDVGGRRGAGLEHHACAGACGIPPHVAVAAVVDGVERILPLVEVAVRAAAHVGHRRVLQMGVGVDQAGGDDAAPVPFVGARVRCQLGFEGVQHPAAGADVHDAAAGYGDGPVEDHRTGDRDDQRRRIQRDLGERLGVGCRIQWIVDVHRPSCVRERRSVSVNRVIVQSYPLFATA